MKRLLLKCTLLMVVFYLILMLLARVIVQTHEPLRMDVFAAYQSYLPGQTLATLRDCESYFLSVTNSSYVTCERDGAFHWIRVIGRDGLIVETWFYPLPGQVRLPDMMAWFGRWEVFHGGSYRWIRWQTARWQVKAYLWRWHGMQSDVSAVYFKAS